MRALDYAMELGIWIGEGNELGEPIPIREAGDPIAGLCLPNDGSARDIRAWVSGPLRPILVKSHDRVAVERDRRSVGAIPERPPGDPAPLPYLLDLADQARGCLAITFHVLLLAPTMRIAGLPPHPLSVAQASLPYRTAAQMVAHHTSNGCNLIAADLLGSGTVSGTTPGTEGRLQEMTRGGRKPVALPNSETRTYPEDGDEVIFTARCEAPDAVPIRFGECRGVVLPSVPA